MGNARRLPRGIVLQLRPALGQGLRRRLRLRLAGGVQGRHQLLYGLNAVFGPDGHALLQHLDLPLGDALRAAPVQGRLLDHPGEGFRGNAACDAVIDRGAEGVHIRPGAQAAPTLVLLHGGEAVFQNGLGGAGQLPVRVGIIHLPHRAEVHQLGPVPGVEHDVVRGDIPVDQTRLMHQGQGLHNGLQNPQGLVHGDPAAPFADVFGQVDALNVLHDHVRRVVGLEKVKDGHNLRHIPEFGHGLGLPQEPLPAGGVARFQVGGVAGHGAGAAVIPVHRAGREEFLDAHPDVQVQVPAQVGDAEASLAQHPAHLVLSRENRAHRKLVGFIVLPHAPAAARAYRLLRQLHTSEASPLLHSVPFSLLMNSRFPAGNRKTANWCLAHQNRTVIANQAAAWCGNPPTCQDCSLGRLPVFVRFSPNRGIATPVCALARNDSFIFQTTIFPRYSAGVEYGTIILDIMGECNRCLYFLGKVPWE